MKTFFTKSALYLALTIPAFFFLGCDDSEEGGSYEFSVEPTVLTFSAKQETQTLSVRTYGDWSIVLPQDAAWLKVSAMSGRGPAEIEVTAENYYRTDTSRTARLTVTGGNSGDFPVEVVQQKLQMNDLSAAGKANCYIVPTSGDFVINAATQGNSESEQVGEWTSAELLWEDNRELITDLYGDPESKRIFFSTAAAGNAVIAVKDASGKILWSWHIWASDFDPNAKTLKYTNDNGSTWEFMDRNLGALTVERGSFDSHGLLYQWGRKDPFPGTTAFTIMNEDYTYEVDGEPEVYGIDNRVLPKFGLTAEFHGTIEKSIRNPAVFYAMTYKHTGVEDEYGEEIVENDYKTGDWVDVSDDDYWGGESRKKTIYDPCPVGYKVPVYTAGKWDEANRGFEQEGQWFPTTGTRAYASGGLDYTEANPYSGLWIGTKGKASDNLELYPDLYGQYMFIIDSKRMLKVSKDKRSQGMSLRCVKE